MSQVLRTAVPFWADRSVSPVAAGPFAQALEASGVVDYFWVWDQLTSWWPHALWSPENTPLATEAADCDSFHDPFITAGIAAAATERLGVLIGGTDAIRNGPAELTQTMLSLASATQGRAVCLVAAGELKQIQPFGYKRSEGLLRLEDMMRATRLLLDADRPVDFDGSVWHFRNAWIGQQRPYRPEFWCLGGGPKLIEIAARYGDGFATALPAVFSSPDRYAAEVARIKSIVEQSGRDPDRFGFALQVGAFLHEDRATIEASFNNPLLRWFAAVAGRFHQGDWLAEGLEPAWPADWHYALKLLPAQYSREEADTIVAKVPPEMVAKSVLWGTPAEVAADIKPYVEAGANFVQIADVLPSVLGREEAAASVGRLIEVCANLKATAG